MESPTTYTFGSFRLDMSTQLLCSDGASARLTSKVYRLLVYFLTHAGHLISHEELFENVWEGRVVEDSALRLAVNTLRKALHDESKSPQYISTVNRRGYRFLAEVRVDTPYPVREVAERRLLSYQAQAQSPINIGFTQELADLHSAFLQAANGERRLVFLYGEQGAGKTRLLDCFLDNLQYSKLALLHTHCVKMSRVAEPFY